MIFFFFGGMTERNGTDVDAANIMKVFHRLGFKTVIQNDLNVSQMKHTLKSGLWTNIPHILSNIILNLKHR